MEDKKRNARIARATEIFTYCMESNDPKLDEVIWLKTLPLSNPRANQVRNYSEPITVRAAILATLFDFPECINVDNRTITDDGVEYYEGKSKFIASSECAPEEQQEIAELKKRLEEVTSQLGDSVTSGEKGNVTLNVNLWLNIEDINFDNIVEWLNSYCSRNVDRVGTRSTEHIYVNVTREALTRAGIEANDFRWRKLVNEKDRIGSRDIVEAVQIKEIPASINKKSSLKDVIGRINEFFYKKRIERDQIKFGKMTAKRQAMLERDRWDHYI